MKRDSITARVYIRTHLLEQFRTLTGSSGSLSRDLNDALEIVARRITTEHTAKNAKGVSNGSENLKSL